MAILFGTVPSATNAELYSHLEDSSVIGRNTQGVRCMALREGDELVSCALVPQEEPEEAAEPSE